MKLAATVLYFLLIFSLSSRAQDYHAIEGSPFAGAIGVANNPASIVNTPYPWDITLFSLQETNTTNALKFTNFGYLTKDTLHYSWVNGRLARYAAFNFNIHLLNVRLAMGRNQAICFGANIRGYASARTGPAFYSDTLKNMNEFFSLNGSTTYNANLVSSSWVEGFISYGRTVLDDAYGRLNAGVTVKGMRGISGAYAQMNGGSVNRNITSGSILTVYDLAAGSGRYAYSANYDYWKKNHSAIQNVKDFLGHTQPGAAVDLGAEYLVKPQTVDVYGEGDSYYDYDWKIGVSLLDLGYNQYKYGSLSSVLGDPKTSVTDSALNQKFARIKSVAGFNDSMATIVSSFNSLHGEFKVWNPARLVINVDRPLPDHFAVNANLTLNLGGSDKGQRLFTKEITLLSVTPRWEVKRLGAYLPVEVTTDGKVWVGGAFKVGPLLMGIDNWSGLFTKTKMANGGIYLALVIRPGKGFTFKEEKRYTCPKE
ncbi:MAG TPA: hypothetical protein VFE32_09480 [Puia sp.]|jgi:hypothetical protein|nr:hypothetical protein [Puia sp.]